MLIKSLIFSVVYPEDMLTMYRKNYTKVLLLRGPPKIKFGKKQGPLRYTNKVIVLWHPNSGEMCLDLETLSKLPRTTTPQIQVGSLPKGALPKVEKQTSNTSNDNTGVKIFRQVQFLHFPSRNFKVR